jgi:hypothetical protein
MKLHHALLCAAAACATPASFAGELYTGLSLPGLTLGYKGSLGGNWGLRGELAGGAKMNRDGQREGLSYDGHLKANRGAVLIDWFPLSSSFRLTGGLTLNDMAVVLNGKGSTGTINGKPVDLTGETFRLDIAYQRTTPYLGLGWGLRPAGAGLGFYVDLGAQFGRFTTDATTTVVGKFNITQADVDAEAQKVRDTVARLGVLPSLGVGLSYRF